MRFTDYRDDNYCHRCSDQRSKGITGKGSQVLRLKSVCRASKSILSWTGLYWCHCLRLFTTCFCSTRSSRRCSWIFGWCRCSSCCAIMVGCYTNPVFTFTPLQRLLWLTAKSFIANKRRFRMQLQNWWNRTWRMQKWRKWTILKSLRRNRGLGLTNPRINSESSVFFIKFVMYWSSCTGRHCCWYYL